MILPSNLQPVVTLLDIVAAVAVSRKLLHLLVTRLRFGAIKNSPRAAAGDELKPGVHHSQPAAMLEARMKVSHLAQLGNDPTLVYELFVTLQLLRGVILCQQRFKDCLRREHAAFDRRVNSLQSLRVEKPGAVANQQHSVGVNLRHREVAAGGDCLRAVANHLAAFEQLRDKRMRLEALKLGVRIEQRILIIQSGDVADIQNAVLHSVDPAAAVRPRVGRKAERVRDAPAG